MTPAPIDARVSEGPKRVPAARGIKMSTNHTPVDHSAADRAWETIDLIGGPPARRALGADGRAGRRTFDKTVSSKPLAFAAGAAPMGIEWRFATRVRVGSRT